MTTPLEAGSFYITTSPRKIVFSQPLKGFSIWNDGESPVKVWTGNTGQHEIKKAESLDFTSDYPIKDVYAVGTTGDANIRLAGAKKFIQNQEQPTEITRVFNPPQKTYIYQTDTSSPQIDSNLLIGLIIIGVVALVCIAGMVIAKK
jgi:hypothetical protein